MLETNNKLRNLYIFVQILWAIALITNLTFFFMTGDWLYMWLSAIWLTIMILHYIKIVRKQPWKALEWEIDWREVPGYSQWEANSTGELRMSAPDLRHIGIHVSDFDEEPVYLLQNDKGSFARVSTNEVVNRAFPRFASATAEPSRKVKK